TLIAYDRRTLALGLTRQQPWPFCVVFPEVPGSLRLPYLANRHRAAYGLVLLRGPTRKPGCLRSPSLAYPQPTRD
ncbi:MAG: hypothetical protein ACPG77_21010, partial [Nannocystaceae bacterium]